MSHLLEDFALHIGPLEQPISAGKWREFMDGARTETNMHGKRSPGDAENLVSDEFAIKWSKRKLGRVFYLHHHRSRDLVALS